MNYFIVALSLFIITNTAFSQPMSEMKNSDAFIKKLTEHSKTLSTIESDFTQKKYLEILEETIISKGYFCFKKENRIRWEYLTPYKYLIIINNHKIQIRDDKKTNTFDSNSNKLFQSMNDMMSSCLKGDLTTLAKQYHIQYLENGTHYVVQMEPKTKQMKEYLKQMQLFFDKTDYSVAKIKMVEPSSDYTEISLINKKVNTPIADEKFVLR